MRKISAPVLTLLSLLVLAPIVGAQTAPKTTLRPIIQENRASASADFKLQREKALTDFKTSRQQALTAFQEKRAQIKTDFMAKLDKIKDAAKKQTAERLEENLNTINQKHTEEFTDRLTKFNNFLDRIISRKDKAKANGKDVAVVETAIINAQTAIALAQSAVAAQSGKSYTINFTTEANLKTAAEAARKQLRSDLMATHTKVAAARKAVVDALQALVGIRGVDDDKPSTTSAKVGG